MNTQYPRQLQFFPAGTYLAQFMGFTKPCNGRVRYRFMVLNEASQAWESYASNQTFDDNAKLRFDFHEKYGTTPEGLRNKGFEVKLGITDRGLNTVTAFERKDFVLPVWFRDKQEAWQAEPGKKAAYWTEREQTDLKFRITNDIRIKTWESLIRKIDHSDLIGCDPETLRAHIEAGWDEGMNWYNYGKPDGWNLDHDTAITKLDVTKPEEMLKVANFKNLKPMWANQNKEKYNE